MEIDVFCSCHGLKSEIRIDERAILADREPRLLVAFKLAPRALPPITIEPLRKRGRPLPPQDPSRFVVYLAGLRTA